MNNASLIASTHSEVLALFRWAPDQQTFGEPEHWLSFADKVELGHSFVGDCDNFALTCAELLIRRGLDSSLVRIAVCWTETNEYHAVCVAEDFCVDNRLRRTVLFHELPYRWHKSMRMNQVGVWTLSKEEQ